jgi:hypothetical protein
MFLNLADGFSEGSRDTDLYRQPSVGFNPRTLGPVASRTTTRPPRTTYKQLNITYKYETVGTSRFKCAI